MRHPTSAYLASGLALLCSSAVTVAHAQAGLNESVWHNIPEYDFAPTQADVTKEQAYTAGTAAAYSFTNTVDGFNYGGNNGTNIGQWFGADAAGAALTDTSAAQYFAFNAQGYIYVANAGDYTFNLGNVYNQVDDAARITVDGNIVAEQNFEATYSDYMDTLFLSAGYHSYDFFYFQTEGGWNLNVVQYGPDGAAIDFVTSAPEPASLAVLAVGLTGLGLLRRRRTTR